MCLLFIQAVCTEEAGVSAHAALPLQECRAKESWRERNGTQAGSERGPKVKSEREPPISTSPIKVLHVLMQYFRFSLHTRPLSPLTLAPQVASFGQTSAESSLCSGNRSTCAESCGSDRSTSMFSPVWTFFSFREMRSQLSCSAGPGPIPAVFSS